MTFISLEFIAFFVIAAALYFAAPHRVRWLVVLVSSVAFYIYGGLDALPLLVLSTLVSYGAGLAVERASAAAARRLIVALVVLFYIGVLVAFKYLNFFGASFAALAGTEYNRLEIFLPLGISFYTFQCMAYPIDIYRGAIKAERHLGIFAAYIAFFPKLIAGPIERAGHMLPQFRQRVTFDEARVVPSLRLILWGVFKKVAIADRLALYVNAVYAEPEPYHGLPMLVAVFFFAFQIYCDFSAYTDIARGAAGILGFNLIENFHQPYLSRSVREFWRRWHISLSTWFRDYLYFPLGGSRVAFPRMLLNLMIVFVVSGLWHGANWTFVIWGALHGAYMVIETMLARARKPHEEAAPHPATAALQILLTFALVCFAWIFFRAPSLESALYVISHLFDFTQGTENLMRPFNDGLFPQEWEFALAFALVGLLIVADWIDAKWGIVEVIGRRRTAVRWALYYGLALIIGISLWLTITASQEFIYRQF